MKTFLPQTFKDLRIQLGRTQAEMAQLMEVSTTTWERWESGVYEPAAKHQAKLDKLLRYAQGRLMK